jgi:hypothetical protein
MKDRQHLKAIVWPRSATKEIPQYRYVIVGILVTESPIESLEGKNKHGIQEFLLDGQVFGMADLLDYVHKGTPNVNHGEASNWLCGLSDAGILEDESTPWWEEEE